ncbi:MAG: hypothetical protein Q9207_005726 [Kuettlingeria erythrocarpa]
MASEDADRQLALSLANEPDPPDVGVEEPAIHYEAVIAAAICGPDKPSDTLVDVDVSGKTMRVDGCTQTEHPSFATCLQHTRDSLKASDVTVICGNEVFKAFQDLTALIAHVYTTTPPNDRGLRDVIRDICALRIDEVTAEPLWSMITNIDGATSLGLELLPLVVSLKNQDIATAKARAEAAEKNASDAQSWPPYGGGGGGRRNKRRSSKLSQGDTVNYRARR